MDRIPTINHTDRPVGHDKYDDMLFRTLDEFMEMHDQDYLTISRFDGELVARVGIEDLFKYMKEYMDR
jgi:hypothetical protein